MRAQRVDKVLVTSGTEVASVAALTAGDYVALVHGKSPNTPITDADKFQFVVGKADGTVKYSDVIKAKDIVSVRKEDYAAVVQQVSTLTLGTPVAGQEYLITIVEKSDKEVLQRRQDKRSYQVTAAVGETATTLADKFVALINGDEAASVTATNAAGVITFTAKASSATAPNAAGQFGVQHYFEVGSQEVNIYGHYVPFGTLVKTTAPGFGNGTFAQVRTLEAYSAGYDEGIYLNRTKFPVPMPSFDSSPSETYDIITIEYDHEYNTNSVVSGKRNADPITLVLAVEAGGTADLETLLAAYIVD